MGTSRKQHRCDEVWQDVVGFLMPPTPRCWWDTFMGSLQYELRVVALPLLRAFRRCRNLSPHEVLLSAHPRFALAFSMHWAVTGSIHAECQRAEVWPHLCPYLVWDVPLWSAYGCVAATGRPDISYFTGGAEQEQRKDHFANTALRAKTEKHGWRNLVGES